MGAAGPGITGDVVVALAEPEATQTAIATSAADTPTAIALRGVGAPTPRRTTGLEGSTLGRIHWVCSIRGATATSADPAVFLYQLNGQCRAIMW